MAARDLAQRKLAASKAAQVRWGAPPDSISRTDGALRVARLEAYVSRVVSEAPPLTPEQASRIAGLLLRGGAA